MIKCQKMIKKCPSFPKAQDDVLKCLVLSTIQRYSVSCHTGLKPIDYQNTWQIVPAMIKLLAMNNLNLRSIGLFVRELSSVSLSRINRWTLPLFVGKLGRDIGRRCSTENNEKFNGFKSTK